MPKAYRVLIPKVPATHNIIDIENICNRDAKDPVRIAYNVLKQNQDSEDIFQTLGRLCGFSEGYVIIRHAHAETNYYRNVSNQREHFIMLVASKHSHPSITEYVDSIYHQVRVFTICLYVYLF